jgi:hypothetical protein
VPISTRLIVILSDGADLALARLERSGAAVQQARDRLDVLATAWAEAEPTEPLRRTAVRLLRVHPLRAADAADREGFRVIQPSNATHAQPADDP